ncbi:MAG: rhomboid family intramembrane serine protease [Planctomycetota bacterium]|jgi:membrane associated rhomboid family serine protease
MGLYDRDYTREDYQPQDRSNPQMRFMNPKLPIVVKRLLLINVAAFLVSFFIPPVANLLFEWFSVYPISLGNSLQLWRLITYQFLHSTYYFGHVLFNMLWLFFFGPILERLWGPRKFLTFYLICGAMGGIFYPFLVLVGWLPPGQLIGASGAILGIMAAVAILFPNLRIYVWGIFPVKMFVLALVCAVISIMTLIRPDQLSNAGGEAAHLAGMVTGAIYVISEKWRTGLKERFKTVNWQRKKTDQRILQVEVDRILKKVHENGIHSLTHKEKKVLKKATKQRQMQSNL